MYYLYIISGILAIGLAFFILISRSRSKMLGFKLADDILWALNFFFKGSIAFTGCAQHSIAILREIVFSFKGKKNWANSPVWLAVFILFFVTMPIYTWAGVISVMPAVASILSTIGFYFKNPHNTRLINVLVQPIMITYAWLVTNYFSLLCSSITLISTVIGLIIDVREKRKLNEM